MRRCAIRRPRVLLPLGLASVRRQRGFTLLEMCVVLLIIAILLGVSMPAMQSAFTEQAVRGDSHQLALMVKTAKLQSEEQRRSYVIDLTSTNMSLHPADVPPPDAVSSGVEFSCQLDTPNILLAPNPEKPREWVAMSPTSWLFQPGELCRASRVRLSRGNAWVEMSFNALTGNVEDEATYFP